MLMHLAVARETARGLERGGIKKIKKTPEWPPGAYICLLQRY